MESIDSIVNRFKDKTEGSGFSEVWIDLDDVGAPDITTAQKSVLKDRELKKEWQHACLALAEALDWGSVEFKKGHHVIEGQHGWLGFCAQANLTMLRDQVYPALENKRNEESPL
tara:strand:- start:68 stop:409 length:342 start_codon:yes stop_codon:yes gene_type:complete